MRVIKYEDIPLEDIEIGTAQARIRDVHKDLDELATSIERVGLLHPIVLAPIPKSGESTKYEVIIGQRRFLAAQSLGWNNIKAGILSDRPDQGWMKALSLIENEVRQDMPQKDCIEACTYLYRTYGTIKAVSEELGLSWAKVSGYVKFDQLVKPLKEKVDSGLDVAIALRAQKAATNLEGEVDTDAAILFADEMEGLSTHQQNTIVSVSQKNPNGTPDEIIEQGRQPPKVKKLTITISLEVNKALELYVDENDSTTSTSDAASEILFTHLVDSGHMEPT